jgi:tRNA(Ile)-lysidine synthase TilS/MesJ
MVLLHLFQKFQKQMKCNFRVITVHHGISSHTAITEYRQESLMCVQAFCEKNKIEFVTNFNDEDLERLEGDELLNTLGSLGDTEAELLVEIKGTKASDFTELKSEQSLRDLRYKQIKYHQKEDEILVLAHHLDDLLETQLMDLIRGSHFEHWQSHKEHYGQTFRPLAYVSREDILAYGLSVNLKWVEDPTNAENESLRNWLRNGFIAELTQKSKGFKENLMQNLVKLFEYRPTIAPLPELEIPLNQWMTLTESDKRQFVLRSAIRLGLKSMTQGQILDIVSKLDLGQKEIKFQTGPIFWTKTTDRLKAYREIP